MATQKISKNQLKAQEAWITPSYVSGWSDYGAEWGGARYMKDSMGFVHLKGLIRNSSGGTKNANDAVFTLPAGYRPTERLRFAIGASPAPGTAQCDVLPTGAIQLQVAIINTEWASLSGIRFKAEA